MELSGTELATPSQIGEHMRTRQFSQFSPQLQTGFGLHFMAGNNGKKSKDHETEGP